MDALGGLVLVFAILISSGCGDASPGIATIKFNSPAVSSNGLIRGNIHCGWGSLWLPLKWGPVPSDTKELAVYIGLFRHETVDGAKKLVVPFGEIISGFRPTLRQNRADTLPDGVVWSNFGRSCPPARRGQYVLQELFALDRTQRSRAMTKRLATRLTEEALRNEETNTNSRSPGALAEDTIGIGQFTATYAKLP